ncbi:hypothetical protein Glove_1033g17 [Diversispora epigaea]|uniref:Uncharacterized protein n=1 Tax=Diversispora epigaea TaxID=1348612 RepID=A0A397FXP6_9GLOM|nr:hypothetical protein Glove_1033g17 [Diversispora epigaea]
MMNRRVSEVALPLGIKYLEIESNDDDNTLLMTYLIYSGPSDDARAELPHDMDEINCKAGVNLLVNRANKIHLYYKFPKLPRSWINENYEGKKALPRLDAVVNEMANKQI